MQLFFKQASALLMGAYLAVTHQQLSGLRMMIVSDACGYLVLHEGWVKWGAGM